MARRIIIHAGFHKTGTKTLQETLSINTALLLPHVEIYLQGGALISSLAQAVLSFSGNRCKDTKAVVSEQAELFFSLMDLTDPRPIFVSSESLSGHFPGSAGVAKYGPAPIAIDLIRDAWTKVTGDQNSFEVYYSTRRSGWLASCHWQRLKTNRNMLSLSEYCEKYAQAADHGAIIDTIKTRLGAQFVHTQALEDMPHPVDPVLEILNLGHLKSQLDIPPNANTSLGETARADLLALNRQKIWGQDYKKARAAILRQKP
ncbi:hypothetical protein EDD53_1619 [Pacificibacter maritimus]|uniref:Sulfotransferase family protein n=1 Tax=Pacificibacter maritimus TaxID=762213 RepID=A0A3N4V2Q0_9RHOB|nr:hypothetical protein [Pacificibacter maritimus]RPE67214.1 hypothetical protein EDD53_1619 [Pacificibacter maritimus]